MVVEVTKLIAAINPDVYCDDTPDEKGRKRSDKVKEIVKKEGNYLKAAEEAELKPSEFLNVDEVRLIKGAFAYAGLKAPIERHQLIYDAFSQNLEPLYFWVLDYINTTFAGAEKLVDNFVSSPGSGHFSEMSQKATILHEKAMGIFATVNTVMRSILNLIYDLKEFRIRLSQYDNFHSEDVKIKNAAMLALKQIWIDNVDIKRGAGSINGLAQQLDFVTIRDAFMAVESVEKVDDLDLNERVKRVLKPRVAEFFRWVDESERELRKRYEIEKIYLKSQVNSLKLYARWLKPYLKAARQLEQNLTPTAELVNVFNTSIFELVLLAKARYDFRKDITMGELPKLFKKVKFRGYTPVVAVEFFFRAIPERDSQKGGYGFRGRATITFTSFALNEDELKVLKEQIEKDDFGDVYKFIENATEQSLGEIEVDLKEFLSESEGKKENKEEENEDTNPFSALFSEFWPSEKKESKNLSRGIPKDNDYEKVVRNQAILEARRSCKKLYDDFKRYLGAVGF